MKITRRQLRRIIRETVDDNSFQEDISQVGDEMSEYIQNLELVQKWKDQVLKPPVRGFKAQKFESAAENQVHQYLKNGHYLLEKIKLNIQVYQKDKLLMKYLLIYQNSIIEELNMCLTYIKI